METDQRMARRRDERRQAGKKLHWRHHAMSLVAPGFADGVGDLTVAQHAQALKAGRGPGAIAKEAFATVTVAG
jgi:hypothetical protein